MKKLLLLLFFGHTLLAQSPQEKIIQVIINDWKENPAKMAQKYAAENFTFTTAEGDKWDKTRTINNIANLKLESIEITDQTIEYIGQATIVRGINTSKWSAGGTSRNYTDRFTYIYKIKGKKVEWLSAQHSLLTPKDRNKAQFRELNKLFNEGKVDYTKFYADSFEIKGLGTGPNAAKLTREKYLTTFPDLQIEIIELIAEGNLVMARCEASGTHKGDGLGYPATGKTMKTKHFTINRFNADGKIIEIWNLTDNLGMMQQLGIIK
jgi:predicted ester cyclase